MRRAALVALLTVAMAQAEPLLVSVSYDQWTRELRALRGRIVVVDAWATWCAPCVERFPHMVQMARKWPASKVVFVTLSLDDRQDVKRVRDFLAQQQTPGPNYLMNEVSPDAFEKLGLNGVPAVFIYDRSGKLVRKLTGDDPNHQFTEADVERAVGIVSGAR